MSKRLVLATNAFSVLLMVFSGAVLWAQSQPGAEQQGSGKPFGARDPRTCPSRKAAPSAAQARLYFICDEELVANPTQPGGQLQLVTDVKVEVGTGRPFNYQSDSFGWATNLGIDPSQTVYPIRGSFTTWICLKLGYAGAFGSPGQNCTKAPQPAGKGICFKTAFGEWHCTMSEGQVGIDDKGAVQRYPPPTGQ
jgi:hypothetical protein